MAETKERFEDSKNAKRDEQKKALNIERAANLLKNISITLAAIFALFYFFLPGLTRSIAVTVNPDRAWYFVGLWNGQGFDNPRFQSGLANNQIPSDATGLISKGTILFPVDAYLVGKVSATDAANGRAIVGRSDHTVGARSVVTRILTAGECISVRESVSSGEFGGKATIWVKGVAINCGTGY